VHALYTAGAALAAASLALGGAATAPSAAAGAAPSDAAVLVYTSDRDGDGDVYAASPEGRVAALTRNRMSDAQVSLAPTGGWIAVVRDNSSLVLVRADGRRELRFRPRSGSASTAGRGAGAFSPAGDAFAFGRRSSAGEASLLLGRIATGIARSIGRGRPYGFSPDGRLLAADGDGKALVVHDLRAGRRRVLAPEAPFEPVFSSSWSRVAYVAGRDEDRLVVADVATGARRLLARGELDSMSWVGESRIGFVRTPPGDAGRRVVVVPAAGGSERVLVSGRIENVRWSPGGDRFAYVRTVSNVEEVVVVPVAGGPARVVHRGGTSSEPVWSPSGRRLAVTAQTSEGSILHFVGGSRRGVGYVPGTLTWSPDERHVAFVSDGEVTLLAVAGGPPRTVTAGGNNEIVGWLRGRLSPTAPRPEPPPAAEVATVAELRTDGPVRELAADGRMAAVAIGASSIDCSRVVGWRAGSARVVRSEPPARCFAIEPELTALAVRGSTASFYRTYWGNYAHVMPCTFDLVAGRRACGDETEGGRAPERVIAPRETRRGVQLSAGAGTITLRRAADDRTRVIRPPGAVVDAELETVGLFYGYNIGVGAREGRVRFVPFEQLFP
jgi:Tol biopolymer transport system component